MSKFSEYLKKSIAASGESILSITHSIGAERTALQRALKGEKILSVEMAHALAIHLQLSLEESQEYFRLYYMQLQGEDQWYNREAVCNLVNQLSSAQFTSVPPRSAADNIGGRFTPSFEYRLVEGEYPVQNIISSILSWEISKDPDTHFRMFLPLGMDFASILLKLWYSGARFTTDHLFCFPSNSEGDCSQSVKILKQIIPMCLTSRDFYHPYYFCERPGSLPANPLGHYIITSHYLILLSGDLSMAFVHSSEDLIDYYLNHFNKLMDHCDPFVSLAESLPEILTRATDIVDTMGCLYLMPQPCFGFSTTPEMIAKYFKADDFSQEIYDNIISHFSLLQTSKDFTTIFSEEGLWTFIQDGSILEYPTSFVSNLDIEDRILFLTQLRDNIASGRITGRIARPSALRIPDYLTTYIDTNGHVWFDTTRCFVYDAFYCNIHITEKSICRALQDFSKSIVDSQVLYSKEETLSILDEGIDELMKAEPKTINETDKTMNYKTN